MNRKRYAEPMLPVSHKSESSLVVCKENALGLITLDVSRTFPSLCIFQKVKFLMLIKTCVEKRRMITSLDYLNPS